jgi:hypothetical protein
VDLNDEDLAPEAWTLRGEYWTNKRRIANDDKTRGTWGRIEMGYKRHKPAPAAVAKLCEEDARWLIEETLSQELPPKARLWPSLREQGDEI